MIKVLLKDFHLIDEDVEGLIGALGQFGHSIQINSHYKNFFAAEFEAHVHHQADLAEDVHQALTQSLKKRILENKTGAGEICITHHHATETNTKSSHLFLKRKRSGKMMRALAAAQKAVLGLGAIMTAACGSFDRYEDADIDPKLKPYVDLFMQDAAERGFNFYDNFNVRSIKFVDEIPNNENSIGRCSTDKDQPYEAVAAKAIFHQKIEIRKKIIILKSHFDEFKNDPYEIRRLMYHELGHCLLDLDHTIDNPSIIMSYNEKPNARVRAQHFDQFWSDHVDDLFDPTQSRFTYEKGAYFPVTIDGRRFTSGIRLVGNESTHGADCGHGEEHK